MSMHKTHAHLEKLNEALKNHRLPHDTPSQSADCFRAGWLAKENDKPPPKVALTLTEVQLALSDYPLLKGIASIDRYEVMQLVRIVEKLHGVPRPGF